MIEHTGKLSVQLQDGEAGERELGVPITLAYVHDNHVAYSWHHSMTELLGYDQANHGRVIQGGYIGIRHGSGQLTQARNKAVIHFLEDAKAEWLFWVDTDMGFAPDTIDRLLDAADPVERPIVGALCFTQTETEEDGMGGWRTSPTPTIFDWAKVRDEHGERTGFAVRWDFPPNTVVRCSGTGAACVLVHRSVFEKIEGAHGRAWYDRVPNTTTGQLLGEDLSFCLRAGALGIPVHVHTGVWTTHLKNTWVTVEDYVRQRAAEGPPAYVPPATEQTAVLVPVLGRPQNAAPFMASLRASTGLAAVYAIVGPEDTAEATEATAAAWVDAGAEVIFTDVVSFAEKINIGCERTAQPWIFITGDDVRFHPGWLDHAQHAAGDRFHVIGTNDLGNPRVMAGDHATHLLIRRSYVNDWGASWDDPGTLAHPGYRHWFVDDEIVTAAKQRGVWVMAPKSIVEHLHPAWGKADDDAVYQLGQSFADADRERFEARCRTYL